jgi:very-short-patch-repair endonuclease
MKEPERACHRIASRQHGVVSRAQAIAAGMSPRAIQHRVVNDLWAVLHPGVYLMPGVPAGWEQEEIAACLWAQGLASHRAAARLWDLPGLASYGRCEVTVTHCHLPPRCGIVVHYTSRLLPHHITRSKGIPVTTIERTLVDLGAVVSRSRVAMAVDDALRRRITTLGKFTKCLAESGGRGRRGAGVIRPILADRAGIDRAPESPLETKLLALLRRSPLPMPELQYEIWDGPLFVARVDFAYPERKLAIEVDGFRFHSGRESFDRDRRRLSAISALGWRLQLVTKADIDDCPDATINRILSTWRNAA